jgi:plastocyanin
MRSRRTRIAALTMIGLAGAGAAAMAGLAVSAEATATRPAAVRALSATGVELRFDRSALRAPAGAVRLVFRNRSDLAHNVALRGPKLARPRLGRVVGRGGVSRVGAVLRPGRYRFYCSVFGHEAGGMHGTLVVTAPPRRAQERPDLR